MKMRLTSIDQLKVGDKIFRIDHCNYKWEIREFVSVYPQNNDFVIMLDYLTQELIKVYKIELTYDNWYLFDEQNSWNEIYTMLADMHQHECDRYKSLIGTKFQPNQQELTEKMLTEQIMYSAVYEFDEDGILELGGRLFSTKEEALADADSVGCQEIKVMIKE